MEKDSLPLLDETDIEILLHRDIHFGGNFKIMLDYYKKDGIGAIKELPVKKIEKLMQAEQRANQNLSDLLLPERSKEIIEDAKNIYLSLRESYEKNETSKIALAITDLILTEEYNPENEIKAVVNYGKEITPLLLDLLKTDKFYSPYYPGYGRAPIFAAYCLELIQDEKAIPTLFQMMGHGNFFTDEALILALVSFNDKAREFLLKRLVHEPFSKENEHAAIVLTAMDEDENTSKTCLKVLSHPEIKKHIVLANYLLLGCSGLKTEEDRALFSRLKDSIPGIMKHEAEMILKSWKKNSR